MSWGSSGGAISVINAMPTGIGATIGIDLRTEAEFTIEEEGRGDGLTDLCVRRLYEARGLDEPAGWEVRISTDIPASMGLKSSSAVCNSTLRAVSAAIGAGMDELDLIRIGVGCAREARVTVTGAFDDACGCALGGYVMTDNRRDELLFRRRIPDYDVVLLLPSYAITKDKVPLDALHALAPRMEKVIELAQDDPLEALTRNGRLIAEATDIDDSIAGRAIKAGALAAGVSGSGPAIAAVAEKGEGEALMERLQDPAYRMLLAHTRCGP